MQKISENQGHAEVRPNQCTIGMLRHSLGGTEFLFLCSTLFRRRVNPRVSKAQGGYTSFAKNVITILTLSSKNVTKILFDDQ